MISALEKTDVESFRHNRGGKYLLLNMEDRKFLVKKMSILSKDWMEMREQIFR